MAASTAVSIRVDVSLEESEVNMNNEGVLDLFPKGSIEEINKKNTKKKSPQEKRKAVGYLGSDYSHLNKLLSDPTLLGMMPKKVKGKRNRMLVWCVQELLRRINNPDTETNIQGTINFASAEMESLRQEVNKLQDAANSINEFIASMKNKKNKWWNLL